MLIAAVGTDEFRFDEESHRYWLAGREMPSVSSILRSSGIVDYRGYPVVDRQRYLERGRAVHAACSEIIQGTFIEDSLLWTPEYEPYIQSFKAFLVESRAKPLLTEVSVYHRGFWYAGRLDFIMEYQGLVGVADIKTNHAQRATRIQTMLYAMAVSSLGETINYEYADRCHLRMGVEVYGDSRPGRARWYENDEEDRAIAISAINCWNWAHAA